MAKASTRKKHNRRKLSVGEPDQGGTHKHSRRTHSVLDDGMTTTTLSNTAAGLRKRTRKGEVTKKSRESRESVQLVRGAGVGVGDGARHRYGGHLVGSGAGIGGPCWALSRRSWGGWGGMRPADTQRRERRPGGRPAPVIGPSVHLRFWQDGAGGKGRPYLTVNRPD